MTSKIAVRGWLGLVLGGAIVGATTQAGSALEYSQHPKDSATVNAILAKGRFEDGDTHDLKRYIAKLPVKPHTVVYFDSPGGSVQESMTLGTFFYQSKIGTYVDAKKICTSACAIAFMGGRGPDGKAHRVKSSTGRLGLHSFSRDFNDRNYSADDMKQVLQRAQTQVGLISEYFRTVEADQDALRIMLTATNSQMNFVSNDDAIGLGVQVFDEKTKAMVDPAPVLEKLAKQRAEAARIAAATAPVTPDPDKPSTTTRATPRTATPRTPGGLVPTAGGSDAPGVTPTPTRVPDRRSVPDTTARRVPNSGNAESGVR
jgi:hypothetical protein